MADFHLTAKEALRSAELSPCGTYRYSLTRDWGGFTQHGCLFVLLNPSTADATKDDPTVRKCVGFARRWNFGGMAIVNLFAYRSTDPRALVIARDAAKNITGPGNADAIKRFASCAQRIVFGWGRALPKELRGHVQNVVEIIEAAAFARPRCLGFTQDGQPRHPLMLAYDTPLEVFSAATRAGKAG